LFTLLFTAKQAVYEHLDEYLSAGEKLRNVLDGRHPPLKEKFGQRVSSVVEQKIRKQCEFVFVAEIYKNENTNRTVGNFLSYLRLI
jgi:hypothetical protein